jgi:hypothetical protein
MGSYLRSGLGASVGVNGAQVGVAAKGKGYVAGGRGGVYFRQQLPTVSVNGNARFHLSAEPEPAPRLPGLPWIIIVAFVLGLLMRAAILGGM